MRDVPDTTKTLLGYIESLPIEEGHDRDVDWGLHGPLLSERIPGHRRWDVWTCFMFGMRYILPRAVFLLRQADDDHL